MRKYLLAAVAAVAISSPALARDGSPYVGIEGGLIIDGDLNLDVDGDYDGDLFEYDDAFDIDFKRGLDLDLIAGYDFGYFRLEAELGYKRLRADKIEIDEDLLDELDLDDDDIDLDGTGSIVSLMANGLFDFGDDSSWNGYVGGGIGRARVKLGGERDSAFAWQFIAGARKAVSPTIDFGLKYRYFRTGKIEAFNDEFDTGNDGTVSFASDGKFRSHSLLASLIFNFAPPPPPPPPVVILPPPVEVPPPATQTCPDGSVILATDACPPAPEPYVPPPPPPEPEKG